METHLPALFWSIARSHPVKPPLIHFVCLGADGAFPSRVRAEAARHGLLCKTYQPKALPEARLGGLCTYKGGCQGNPGSYYGRWLLSELLPSEIDRVVYLDVDVLVQSDLHRLIQLLPEGMMVAAVPDMPFGSCPDKIYRNYYLPHLMSLGITTRRGKMFNSGVLVLSLRRWRDEKLVHILLQTRDKMLAKGLSLRFQDQDVLNVALGGRIHPLPSDWNVTPLYLPAKFWARDDLSLVKILHFVTTPKPWHDNQWMILPAQAVKVYMIARAYSEANAEESKRWRTYFNWYEQLTNGGTTPLTPARLRRLKNLVATFKDSTDSTPIRTSFKSLQRASKKSRTNLKSKHQYT